MARTRRNILVGIMAAVSISIALEWFVLRAAYKIIKPASEVAGCACGGALATGPKEWAVFGLSGMALAGIILGLSYMAVTLIRTRRLVQRLTTEGQGQQIIRVSGARYEAFTFGFFRPKIALSLAAGQPVSQEELRAMLTHEAHHVARRDPLKFFTLDTLKYVFFYVPLIRELVARYRMVAELEADDAVDNREALGEALLRMASGSSAKLIAVASFTSLVPLRVERIMDSAWQMPRLLQRKAVFLSMLIVVAVAGALTRTATPPSAPFNCMQQRASCAVIDETPAGYYYGIQSNI